MAILKENLESILASFEKTVRRLDKCAEQNEAIASRVAVDMARMEDERDAALGTAGKARRIRDRISELVA